jgi:L-ascorbate metabolism protein UlaG (beta-lactamase superfamily)
VSWIVEADGVRVFHGGDTLFHGEEVDLSAVLAVR